ncbi:hypothetical protein VaNZ11_011445, partial [Volvox africanus]
MRGAITPGATCNPSFPLEAAVSFVTCVQSALIEVHYIYLFLIQYFYFFTKYKYESLINVITHVLRPSRSDTAPPFRTWMPSTMCLRDSPLSLGPCPPTKILVEMTRSLRLYPRSWFRRGYGRLRVKQLL